VRGEGGLDWFDGGAVLGLFHRTKDEARRRYAQFVREGVDGPSPWAAVRGQIFLGDEPFLKKMANLIKKQLLTNVPRVQRQPTRLTGGRGLTPRRRSVCADAQGAVHSCPRRGLSVCGLVVTPCGQRTVGQGGGPVWGFTISHLPYPTGARDPGPESAASPGKESMQDLAMTPNANAYKFSKARSNFPLPLDGRLIFASFNIGAQHRIHPGLIASPLLFKPFQNVRI